MSIYRGTRPVTKLYRGTREVVKVCRGTRAVYEKEPATDATLLYFTLTSNLTQALYFTQSAANGVTIDWGDGSTPETVADLSAQASHTYAEAGDYVVRMTAAYGVTWSPGAVLNSENYGIIGKQQSNQKSGNYATLTAFNFGVGCELTMPYAFTSCTSLTSTSIPAGTVEIPDRAFNNCTSLAKLTIPPSLRRSHLNSFYNVLSIEELHVSDFAAYCGMNWAIDGNIALHFPVLSSHNIYLNSVAITGENADLIIPSGVTKIGKYTFADVPLHSVTLPSSIRTIERGAFAGPDQSDIPCSFTFGGNPVAFEENVFEFRSITAVSVTSLETWLGCTFKVSLDGTTSSPLYGSDTLLTVNGTVLSGNVEIPASVASLNALAFLSRKSVTAFWIRSTVDSMEVQTVTSGNKTITGTPFTNCDAGCVIYCEDSADQAGWDAGWNTSLTVVYNQTTRPW